MQCKITLFTAFFVALAIALLPLFQRIGSSFSSFDGIGVPSPGALPCLKAGRVMPVSSAAADSLKLASGRTSVNLGGSRTGPLNGLALSTGVFFPLFVVPDRVVFVLG